MEKLYWDTINFNDQKLYFTVNNNGLNFISDANQGLSQIFDFYPNSKFEFRNQRSLTARYADQFESYIIGERSRFDLPIDIVPAGNNDEQRVWQLIMQVPYGSILSFQDLVNEAHLGDAIVKQALAHSPLTMIIPIHRIICENGINNRLRGGAAMQSQLLEMEAINGLDDLE